MRHNQVDLKQIYTAEFIERITNLKHRIQRLAGREVFQLDIAVRAKYRSGQVVSDVINFNARPHVVEKIETAVSEIEQELGIGNLIHNAN